MVEYEDAVAAMEAVLLIHADGGIDWQHFSVDKESDSTSVSAAEPEF